MYGCVSDRGLRGVVLSTLGSHPYLGLLHHRKNRPNRHLIDGSRPLLPAWSIRRRWERRVYDNISPLEWQAAQRGHLGLGGLAGAELREVAAKLLVRLDRLATRKPSAGVALCKDAARHDRERLAVRQC